MTRVLLYTELTKQWNKSYKWIKMQQICLERTFSEWVLVVYCQLRKFSAISWRQQGNEVIMMSVLY